MYLDISDKHNFQRPASPIPRLGADDAAVVAALIGGQIDPDADGVAQLDRILASTYGAASARPVAFTDAVRAHGGRAVALAVEASYFWTGRSPQDVMLAAESIAAEAAEQGTGRLGPPLEMDGPEPGASEIVTEDLAASGPAVETGERGHIVPSPFTAGERLGAYEYAEVFRRDDDVDDDGDTDDTGPGKVPR
jgi:hypothetical protein